ncbi:putative disease resistance protein At3g14460 [Mangifera indica]|uniref:putative disease resistance protein At3g14460 n=1 Tax=Mangifera indica TaxID=29780 RepID=UPI001CF95FC9|nr:putative disease resistance protein At3g14460 [Mangifera indica]
MDVVLEPVVSELVKGLLKILRSNEVRDFARQLVGGVDSEIKELENKLKMVENLLRNAENWQLVDKQVKEWLDNLQHWAYDAEDLLDEFAYEALRHKRKAEHQASSSRGFSCLPACFPSRSFAFKMGSKIKEINSRLEQLCEQRSEERKLPKLSGLPATNVAAPPKPEETSSVPLGQVYGRNEDEVELLKMVKSGANFQLIAVVGVGGIGKTTIAREVYNHKELEDIKFEKKAWVCVSTTFDVLTISKKLLQQFSSSVPDNLNDVQVQLKGAVSGKKFLIVLDDIWKVEYIEWEKLKSPFAAGALGSTMIVTTRHEHVAKEIRCSHTYQLKLLSDEACKSLFKEHAFGTGAAANADQIFISIYDRVVKRCKGLPLAAKTLGCLLHSKPSNAWEEILESKIWSAFDESDHILPTLKLSYHYLPSNLKRCFGYCAIFPQDYEFEEKELALLWIAEGIVQPSNKQLDKAGQCFHKLCSRSFFQQLSSDSSKYVMHDLVHDLAQSVFKGISFRSEQNIVESSENFEKIRHFTYEPDEYTKKNKFKALEKAKSLRTFLHVRHEFASYISAIVIFDLLAKLDMLRVLSFEGHSIIYLPNSIGGMKHLRYLNFSNTLIKSLPESTCQLFNLQTLLLKYCSVLMKLPSNMRYLTNLYHLDISGQNSLKEMPFGMKELENLQILSNFIVGKNAGSNLEDLKSLSLLQGELHISELQNVTNSNQIREQILSNKNNLKVLLLEWGYEENSMKADIEMKLLDKLKPPSNLKELTIRGYGGESFPSWLGDCSWLSNLVVLKLEECKRCMSLPSLEMLSSLEDLTIKEMASLKRIDFQTPFKSLEFLHFENLKEWEHWDRWRGNEIFPKLRVLSIIECPQLIGEALDYLSSLERFVIKNCPKLVVSFSNYPIHCKLEIDDCEGMVCDDGSIDFKLLDSKYLANIPMVEDKLKKGFQRVDRLKIVHNEEIIESWQSLENTNFLSNVNSLEISECQNLRSIGRGMLPSFLKEFYINSCQSLTFIDSDVLPLSLKRLRIERCGELKFLKDLSVCSLIESIRIFSCKSLKYISLDGPLPETLNQLDVKDCKALETLSSRRNEYLPRALTSIYIIVCEELKSIAESFDNSTCLRKISLFDCKNLESLPSGLHHLPCLESIYIIKCPKLSVREGVPTSLRQLLINECEDGKGMGMLASLKHLIIWDLPQLKSISDLTNLTSLKYLFINKLPQLELIPNLSGLTSLEDLQISKCPRIKSIPSLSGLTSFQELEIADLPQLESIQDLSNLTSLEDLQISECPKLRSLQTLPSSLQSLQITDCPLLIKRWKSVTGKYSSKIAQIPKVVIDGKFIYNSKEYEVDDGSFFL